METGVLRHIPMHTFKGSQGYCGEVISEVFLQNSNHAELAPEDITLWERGGLTEIQYKLS